jgi:hypothetical protein
MAMAAATTTMAATVSGARCGHGGAILTGGGEDRKLFGQSGRAAMRTGSPFPITGADEDFAIALAFFTMKFVNRHRRKDNQVRPNLKPHQQAFGLSFLAPKFSLPA